MKKSGNAQKRASYMDIDTDAELHETETTENEGPCDDR